MAFVIGAIVGDLPAPESSTDIDWLQIKKVEGLLADSLYRVDTVGGKPPPSVSKVHCHHSPSNTHFHF